MANQLVERSHPPVRRTLETPGVPRATFYRWYELRRSGGPEALEDRPARPSRVWSRLPDEVREQIVDLALEEPELSPRELAVRFTDEERYFVSEATVYRLLKAHDLITSPAYIVVKAADEFRDKMSRVAPLVRVTMANAPNRLWRTDFTYLKVAGWGWYHLPTVLDDFSRFVAAWKLCATTQASNGEPSSAIGPRTMASATLDLAASRLDRVTVLHRPRLLTDDGSSAIAGDLAAWREGQGMTHTRGAPRHPQTQTQTQGKIERWHQTLKNVRRGNDPPDRLLILLALLEHYCLPGALEQQIGAFVERTNHARAHESLGNLTPADVHHGRGEAILAERAPIKRRTLATRRLLHHARAA